MHSIAFIGITLIIFFVIIANCDDHIPFYMPLLNILVSFDNLI